MTQDPYKRFKDITGCRMDYDNAVKEALKIIISEAVREALEALKFGSNQWKYLQNLEMKYFNKGLKAALTIEAFKFKDTPDSVMKMYEDILTRNIELVQEMNRIRAMKPDEGGRQ